MLMPYFFNMFNRLSEELGNVALTIVVRQSNGWEIQGKLYTNCSSKMLMVHTEST
jgi:hypothetical protein